MLGHRDASVTLAVHSDLVPDNIDEVADAMDIARELARGATKTTPSDHQESHAHRMATGAPVSGHDEGRRPVLSLVSGLSRSG